MNVLKSGLARALIPLVILSGMALTLALALQLTNEPTGAKDTLVAGVIVAAVAGFSVLYDIESWSLAKQIAVHFVCMAVTVLSCLVFSGWLSVDGPQDVLVVLGYFLVTAAVPYGLAYLMFGKHLGGSSRELRNDASSRTWVTENA